jgi:hypothetical protein
MSRPIEVMLFALLLLSGCTQGSEGPKDRPTMDALVGAYTLSAESKSFLERRKGFRSVPNGTVTLRGDGTVSIIDLADCYSASHGGSGRYLTGDGLWEIESTDFGYGITLTIGAGGTLPRSIYHGSSILISGKSAPFGIRFVIGDPDTNESIMYERVSG